MVELVSKKLQILPFKVEIQQYNVLQSANFFSKDFFLANFKKLKFKTCQISHQKQLVKRYWP